MGWRGRERKQENLNALYVPPRALLGETVPRHGWPAYTLPLPFLSQNLAKSHITFPHFAAVVQVCDMVVVFFFNESSMNVEEC